MTTSYAIFSAVIAFAVGAAHGVLWRFGAYWRRGALYVRNDEYRVAVFAASVIGVLFALRELQSYIVYHAPLKEGVWPIAWALVYCYGITWGFRRTKRVSTEIPPVTGIPEE